MPNALTVPRRFPTLPRIVWTLEDRSGVTTWLPRDSSRDAVLAFSTRLGGVSRPPFDSLNLGRSTEDDPGDVAENRRRYLAVLGFQPAALATAGQVHGTTVAEVKAPGVHPACDALVTRVPGIALAITGADCTPLLLVARTAIAAVHSGWRGTAGGVTTAALRKLLELSPSTARDVTVHIGPSIRACCYRVGDEVARQFPSETVRYSDGAWHLDLVAAARLQLGEAGVPEERIHDVAACTACDPLTYFSHRRDGPRTGRHWAVAALSRARSETT
jgi:hypothetical protein